MTHVADVCAALIEVLMFFKFTLRNVEMKPTSLVTGETHTSKCIIYHLI